MVNVHMCRRRHCRGHSSQFHFYRKSIVRGSREPQGGGPQFTRVGGFICPSDRINQGLYAHGDHTVCPTCQYQKHMGFHLMVVRNAGHPIILKCYFKTHTIFRKFSRLSYKLGHSLGFAVSCVVLIVIPHHQTLAAGKEGRQAVRFQQ